MRLFDSNLSLHIYLYNFFSKYSVFVWHMRNTPNVNRITMTVKVFWKKDKWKELYI